MISDDKIKNLLIGLMNVKGIDIAMASTILRFKNNKIFQIMDQRVYRLLYGKEMVKTTVIKKKIDTYIKYLKDLRAFCTKKKIDFTNADRILYVADKEVNKEIKLK